MNLLSNALKFTDEGEVRVQCKMQNENYKSQNESASVSDFVEMLEISVSVGVESEVGKGSVFTVMIPVVYEEG